METLMSAKEEVRQAADIVEVIGQFVNLRKAGQNYLGLCPFHSEKTPSFTVSPARQMFHCFGCKKGGDVFAFWMDYHHVGFMQALRDLAERYSITIEEQHYQDPEKKKALALRDEVFRLNNQASAFFSSVLLESKSGGPAREYLEKRGIKEATVQEFNLGYAPNMWNGLCRYLKNRGADMDQAEKAGLIIPRKQGGWYDRFRGRVVFPIYTTNNLIAGFGARVLDDALPKYLNTPETPVFKKGETLFGLNVAGPKIRQSRRAVIVEGYTDVLALHQSGFKEAVATLGTALTRNHIRKLKGYADEIVLVFDSDDAGKNAAIKSLPHFLAEGLSSRVTILPEGEDPDTFLRRYGLGQFEKEIAQAVPLFDYYIDTSISKAGEGVETRANAVKEVLKVLTGIHDRTRTTLYVQRLAQRLNIPESVILHELGQNAGKTVQALETKTPFSKRLGIDDAHLLNLLVHYPEAISGLFDYKWQVLVSHDETMTVLKAAARQFREKGCVLPSEVQEFLGEEKAQSLFREAMMSSPFYREEDVEQAIEDYKVRIQERSNEKIIEAERLGDLERANLLLKLKQERDDSARR